MSVPAVAVRVVVSVAEVAWKRTRTEKEGGRAQRGSRLRLWPWCQKLQRCVCLYMLGYSTFTLSRHNLLEYVPEAIRMAALGIWYCRRNKQSGVSCWGDAIVQPPGCINRAYRDARTFVFSSASNSSMYARLEKLSHDLLPLCVYLQECWTFLSGSHSSPLAGLDDRVVSKRLTEILSDTLQVSRVLSQARRAIRMLA